MTNTTDILNELYRIYEALNAHYFDSSLPEPFIVIKQGKTKNKNVYGTFTAEAWAHKDGEEINEETGETRTIVNENKIHEIAMSGEYLSRPTANMCATLCHEMVHLYCKVNDIDDTSNNGVYHNNKFKREAQKRGLIIEKADTIGWSVTTPSTEFIDFIKSLEVEEEVFKYFRETWLNITTKATPKKRWVCPICGQKAQAKKDAHIGCWDCGLQMDYWDLTDEDNPEIIEDFNNGLAHSPEGWYGYLMG